MADKPRFVGEKRTVALKEICILGMGQSPSSNSYNVGGDGLPFYQGNADFGEENPVPRTWCTNPKKIAEKGDVLVSVRAPIGAINIANEKCCIGRGIAAIRPNPDIAITGFLRHQLVASRSKLEAMGTGSTFKAVGKKALGDFPIVVYSKSTQEAIECQLNCITKQIKAINSQLDQFDSLVKSRFVEMFGDPVVNPMGWGVSTIKKTAITYGDGPFGSNLKSTDYVPSGVRVIRLGNIMRGEFSEKDKSYVSYEKFESLRKYECIPGEVIIATLGDPLLRACIVPDFGSPSIHKADCMYYETNKEMVLPIFAMCAINQPSMLQRALLDSHGQTRARINSTQVGNLPMILPPLTLQQEFADFVSQVDKARLIAQQQIDKLQTLYDSLAQEYFA